VRWAPDSMSDERFLTSWRKTREAGFWRYFLVRIALGLAVVMVLFGPGVVFLPAVDLRFSIALIFFAVMAISFIPFTWRRHEARYRRLLGHEQSAAFD
jgi:hypothetical protein